VHGHRAAGGNAVVEKNLHGRRREFWCSNGQGMELDLDVSAIIPTQWLE
jgi:hypothetical protein